MTCNATSFESCFLSCDSHRRYMFFALSPSLVFTRRAKRDIHGKLLFAAFNLVYPDTGSSKKKKNLTLKSKYKEYLKISLLIHPTFSLPVRTFCLQFSNIALKIAIITNGKCTLNFHAIRISMMSCIVASTTYIFM